MRRSGGGPLLEGAVGSSDRWGLVMAVGRQDARGAGRPWGRWVWPATAVAAVGVAWLVGRLVGAAGPTWQTELELLATGAGLLAAILVLLVAYRVVESANARRIAALAERAEEAEHVVRLDQDLLHEVRSSVAGLRSASGLLQPGRSDAVAGSERLHGLLVAELRRLERLLEARPHEVTDVDLDDVLALLADVYRARGLDVRPVPTGLLARARCDDVADVVRVLLDNAQRHAPGSTVRITAGLAGDGDEVELAVADDGPGVPEPLRGRIFDRGVRDPSSPGRGLGLDLACRLASEQGGSLRLEPSTRGSRFVLALPAAMHGRAMRGNAVTSAGRG